MVPVAGPGEGVGSTTSLYSEVAAGSGGIIMAFALLALLAYFEIIDVSAYQNEELRTFALASVIPLLVTFVSIVLYELIFVLGAFD